MDEPFRIFNTWMGDPAKLVLLDAVVRTVREEGLLDVVNAAGDVLLAGLAQLQAKHKGKVSGVRGLATFASFDLPSPEARNALIQAMMARGESET